jgi:hypothetical protein
MKFSTSVFLFWIPSAFQCMMVIPGLSFPFFCVARPVACPRPLARQDNGGTSSRLGGLIRGMEPSTAPAWGDPHRTSTISVNSVSEYHIGCECMASWFFRKRLWTRHLFSVSTCTGYGLQLAGFSFSFPTFAVSLESEFSTSPRWILSLTGKPPFLIWNQIEFSLS